MEERCGRFLILNWLEHFACWYRVEILLGSRLLVAARTGSAGLLAGCHVDLPVHAALYSNRRNARALLPSPSMPTVIASRLAYGPDGLPIRQALRQSSTGDRNSVV